MQFAAAAFSDDESQSAVVTVIRSFDISGTSTVLLSTSDITALGSGSCSPGADYIATVGQTITFNPSTTVQTVTIPLCSDSISDPGEMVGLTLSSPSGGVLGSQNTAVLSINDTASQIRNPNAIALLSGASANPYPSTINVTGGPANVGSVRVTLYDLSHSLPDNIDVLLVGPNGAKYVLFADSGGSLPVNATLTFSDVSGAVLQDAGQLATGEFKPTTYETPISNFPSPAPLAPYVEPGSSLSRPAGQTLAGNFGNQNGNGVWSLFVRDDNAALPPGTAVGQIAGGWGLELIASSVTPVTISGRVTTSSGSFLKSASVILMDSQGVRRAVLTNQFGLYSFDSVLTGGSYTIIVVSKRFRFAQQVVQVSGTLTNVDFVGIE